MLVEEKKLLCCNFWLSSVIFPMIPGNEYEISGACRTPKPTQRHSMPLVQNHQVWIPADTYRKTVSSTGGATWMACKQRWGHNVLPKHRLNTTSLILDTWFVQCIIKCWHSLIQIELHLFNKSCEMCSLNMIGKHGEV